MTRKDYVLIANAFSKYKGDWMTRDDEVVYEGLALSVANELSLANPNFDHQRFMTACNLG